MTVPLLLNALQMAWVRLLREHEIIQANIETSPLQLVAAVLQASSEGEAGALCWLIDRIKAKRSSAAALLRGRGESGRGICCAGVEVQGWRCVPVAEHLIEWLAEYVLPEDELAVTHVNMYDALAQAQFCHHSARVVGHQCE